MTWLPAASCMCGRSPVSQRRKFKDINKPQAQESRDKRTNQGASQPSRLHPVVQRKPRRRPGETAHPYRMGTEVSGQLSGGRPDGHQQRPRAQRGETPTASKSVFQQRADTGEIVLVPGASARLATER